MEALLSFLKEFEIAKLLPEINSFVNGLAWLTRLAILTGPLLMLGLGLWYHYKPSEEPGRAIGFLGRSVMGSSESWQFAQRMAGVTWMIVGGGLAVIMLILSILFVLMRPIVMVTVALICLILEIALILAAQIYVNRHVLKYYDKDGNRLK